MAPLAHKGFSDAVIAAYRGWHDYVKKEEGWEAAKWILINDLSLSSVTPESFRSEGEIEETFLALRERAPDQKSKERLQHSLNFLSQKEAARLTKESLAERGIPWMPISESFLEETAECFLQTRTLAIERGLLSKEQARDRYRFKPGPEGIINELDSHGRRFLGLLADRFPALAPARFSSREILSDSPVHNMVTFEDGSIHYIANRNPLVDYNDGRREFLAMHEVGGHVLHFSQLLAAGALRAKAPHLLCLSIHTYDSFFIEGIAQLMTSVLADRILPLSALTVDIRRAELWFAVVHHNMTSLIEGSASVEDAADKEIRFLGGDRDSLIDVYRSLIGDAFFTCQTLVYTSSHTVLKPLLDLPDPELTEAVTVLMRDHHSPSELQERTAAYAG